MTEQPPVLDEELNMDDKAYRNQVFIGGGIILAITALIIGIIFIFQNATPKIVYQPVNACDLMSLEVAQDLLGDKATRSGGSEPAQTDNTAVSRCGYTDGGAIADQLKVAAITIRSGINDKGVQQNREEFTGGVPDVGVELVTDLGDSAYFNAGNGQLNVLDDKNWFIFSYGVGSSPLTNTLEDAVAFARLIVK